MIETEIVETNKGAALAYRHLLGNKPPWLVIIQGSKGYLATDYINKEFADEIGDCFAVISGAKTFEDMLSMKVTWVSREAKKLGITPGMAGKSALNLLI